jgi:hypothetical protein
MTVLQIQILLLLIAPQILHAAQMRNPAQSLIALQILNVLQILLFLVAPQIVHAAQILIATEVLILLIALQIL